MGIRSFINRKIREYIKLTREKILIPVPSPVNTNSMLEGNIALITGGTGGIGMAIAKAFLNSGAKVIISGRDESKLKSCISKITQVGGGLIL